jgi:DNA-binding MarR family transcriptional regulator
MNQVIIREGFTAERPAGVAEAGQLQPALTEFRTRSRYADVIAIREGLRARRLRDSFFNPKLFADPAWDMLLELYVAAVTQRRLTVSRLCERSGVPSTTALRWISTLEQDGLVNRCRDRLDGRQAFLSLSDKGCAKMSAYLEEVQVETKLL